MTRPSWVERCFNSPKHGLFVVRVDLQFAFLLDQRTWSLTRSGKSDQVYLYSVVTEELFHRVVWQEAHPTLSLEGRVIDHRNMDGLDNRVQNLRACTHSQNLCNRGKPRNNTSGHKGVSFDSWSGKWRACITVRKKVIKLGRFDTMEEAVFIRRAAAEKLHGEFCRHE